MQIARHHIQITPAGREAADVYAASSPGPTALLVVAIKKTGGVSFLFWGRGETSRGQFRGAPFFAV